MRPFPTLAPATALSAVCLAALTLLPAVALAAPRPASFAGIRLAPATPGGVRFTVQVPAPKLTPIESETGVARLELEGYEGTGLAGEPELPVRSVVVAVPPLGDVRLTAVASDVTVSEDVTLAPNHGIDDKGQPIATRRDPAAYGRAGTSMPAAARLVAVTWMRNQRVARIVIEPVAYEPGDRRLHVAGRVDVELSVNVPGVIGPPAEPQDPFEPVYRASLVNYQQGRAWRRPRTRDLALAAQRSGASASELALLAVPPDTSVYVGRDWVKIAIEKTGFYAINFSRLRGLQVFSDPQQPPVPFDSLRLFTWPGRTVLPENSYCDSCDYREVAIGIVRDVNDVDNNPDGKFASNQDAFYFFAQGPNGWANDYDASSPDTAFINHPYERFNYYYLTAALDTLPVSDSRYPNPPLRIGDPTSTRDVAPDDTEVPQPKVAGRLHFEQDNEYWPDAASTREDITWEKWFWRSLSPGQIFPHSFTIPDADVTQPARFLLRHWGLTRNLTASPCAYPGFDHRVSIQFNSIQFPTAQWADKIAPGGFRTFDTTGVFLNPVENDLIVSVPFYTVSNCPVFVDRSGLAYFEIYYDRFPRPVQDAIDFRSKPGTGTFRWEIGPFVKDPSTSWLFDVTDPLRPVMLQGARTNGNGTDVPWTLSVADTQSMPHRYFVVPDSVITSNSAVMPVSALSNAPSTSLENLRDAAQAADYLILYYDGFAAAAESLKVWRESHLPLLEAPHLTKKVPISAIYDQFSGGRTDPGAMRNFLRAVSGWSVRPLYVTFLGDASYDYKDITGRAVPGQPGCLLPTFENNFDNHPLIHRQYATDDWIVNVDDPVTVLPDYLAGRIPAGDASSALDIVVRKVLAYERAAPFGEYRNNAILLADDAIQKADCDVLRYLHVGQTNSLNINNTPPETDRTYVYLHTFPAGPNDTRPAARTALFSALNRGASLLNYVGHGSPFKMTDEGVFLDSDAGTLVNGLKLPLLVAASCDVGKFNDPTVQSLGERLMTHTGGGCIAVISATELALSGQNSFLNGLIYDGLFTRDTVTVAGVEIPGYGQYHLPASAALLAAKSVPTAQGTNSQKYQLMGDAATVLALPKLWPEIKLMDEQGAPIDTLVSGQLVRFEGQVLDQPGGTLVPVDGVASMLIEDSAPTNRTPNDCPPAIDYRFTAGPMYHGDVTLTGGSFQGRFIVPLGVTIGSEGRARAYITGRAGLAGPVDGVGSVRVDVDTIGTQPAGSDDDGPRITLSFVGGSTNVRGDAVLQINLFDPSGIMTTAHAPVNSIIVMLDGNTTSRVDVTSSFRYAADSHQSGAATFQLPGLAAGPHEVQVSAADNFASGIDAGRHRSRATLQFQVVDTPPLRVARTFLFPNPVHSGGSRGGGVFVVDAPGDSINTQIRVYTVAGKLVRVLKQFGGIGQVQVHWDGLDDDAEPLAQGTYLYKVYVSAREADGKSSPRQKATAEGRFVVLSP